ncbi:hypothetical protein V5O48_005782 [Marasmius crinis-equi]|uniref:F-box domain-containing protein n=1 Tax=Marasmius crinis-equi TaxID=585013 RepID=A0ABR3FLT9_9AGAR
MDSPSSPAAPLCPKCSQAYLVSNAVFSASQTEDLGYSNSNLSRSEATQTPDWLEEEAVLEEHDEKICWSCKEGERFGGLESVAVKIKERQTWVGKLPVEVLREIFALFCFCNEHTLAILRDRRGNQIVESPSLTLSQVCHKWRQISKSFSSLWASICVDVNRPSHTFESIISTYLTQSAHIPLHIRICDSYTQSGIVEGEDYRNHRLGPTGIFIFDTLINQAFRAETLVFEEIDLKVSFSDDASTFASRGLPLLRRFAADYAVSDPPSNFLKVFERTPLLQIVCIDYLNSGIRNHLPCHQITTLTITSLDFSDFCLLGVFTALEKLVVRRFYLRYEPEVLANQLVLTSLHHLSLHCWALVIRTLRSVPTPVVFANMKTLELTFSSGTANVTTYESWPDPSFLSLIHHFSSSLKRLSISFPKHRLRADAVRQAAQSFTSLMHMSITVLDDDSSLTLTTMSALTIPLEGDLQNQLIFLPELTSLTLQFSSAEHLYNLEIADAIATMIISRSQPKLDDIGRTDIRSINSVTLRFSDRSEADLREDDVSRRREFWGHLHMTKITQLVALAAFVLSQGVYGAPSDSFAGIRRDVPVVPLSDDLLSSSPGPGYALTNNYGTSDPVWVPVTANTSLLEARYTCNGPHMSMWSGGSCGGMEIRHLTLSNNGQCYDSKTNPSRGFSSANIDTYNGGTGTNAVEFYRGGSGNYCGQRLYTLINFLGCATFDDGFNYANGVIWTCP